MGVRRGPSSPGLDTAIDLMGAGFGSVDRRLDLLERGGVDLPGPGVGLPEFDPDFTTLFETTETGVLVTFGVLLPPGTDALLTVLLKRNAGATEEGWATQRIKRREDIDPPSQSAERVEFQFADELKFGTTYDALKLIALVNGVRLQNPPVEPVYSGYPGNVLLTFTTPSRPLESRGYVLADWNADLRNIELLDLAYVLQENSGDGTISIGFYDLGAMLQDRPDFTVTPADGVTNSTTYLAMTPDLYGFVSVEPATPGGVDLIALDLRSPGAQASAGFVTGYSMVSLVAKGDFLYGISKLSADRQLVVLDISTPMTPVVLGAVQLTTDTGSIFAHYAAISIYGNYALCAVGWDDGEGRLKIVDISTPSAPAVVLSITTNDQPERALRRGATLYVPVTIESKTVEVYDVADPPSTSLIFVSDPIGTNALRPYCLDGRQFYLQAAQDSPPQYIGVRDVTSAAFESVGSFVLTADAHQPEPGWILVTGNRLIVAGAAGVDGGIYSFALPV